MPFPKGLAALVLASLAVIPLGLRAEVLQIKGLKVARDLACAAGEAVTIDGIEHELTVTGPCGPVTVTGARHRIVIEQATELKVNGHEHQLQAGSATALELAGQGSRLKAAIRPSAPSEAASARAPVVVMGSRQIVDLALETAIQLRLTGFQNRVEWTLAEGVAEPALNVAGAEHAARRKR